MCEWRSMACALIIILIIFHVVVCTRGAGIAGDIRYLRPPATHLNEFNPAFRVDCIHCFACREHGAISSLCDRITELTVYFYY